MARPSHRSPRRSFFHRPSPGPSGRGRRAVVISVSVAAVAAAVLVASLVMAFRSDSEAGARYTAATPATGARVTDRPTPPERKPSKGSPTATASATTPAAATAATTATTATTPPARPSARDTPRAVSAAAPLAGRIRPDATYQGVATHYDAGTGDGACLYGPSDDLMVAAMNHTDYEVSKACGAYVLVRAAGGASVTVRITNECPLPCAPGQLDLSKQAFAKLAELSRGRIPITWSLLSPSTSDTVSIRYKTGSSPYWCGIQVIDHRNPVARLEVRAGSGWRRLPRTEYNYFLSADGSGCGGAIRVTDIYGEQLTINGIALRPDAVQPTRVQFARH
ncbi:expansin EXLX1 family cellulose-binding protein [Streptomyces cavernae]|uniref:expansin EXLX1 family cellulose-binding protein n=1 Tax=Streptomyces cavernae TaxID=2259034 RepID=UPI000FEBDC79|nr:expansin EXLX1 family cellulose-binding protein [Streptomyces cavernae]